MCARPLLCPFGTENLDLGPVLSIHVPVLARLGMYPLKTWLYDPRRVCLFLLEPIRASTLGKPGFTPPFEYARGRSSPVAPVRPQNLAVRHDFRMYVPDLARLGMYALKTWLYDPGRI